MVSIPPPRGWGELSFGDSPPRAGGGGGTVVPGGGMDNGGGGGGRRVTQAHCEKEHTYTLRLDSFTVCIP